MTIHLPEVFNGPDAWVSADLAGNADAWLKMLSTREVVELEEAAHTYIKTCLLYTSPSPRDRTRSRMPSSA